MPDYKIPANRIDNLSPGDYILWNDLSGILLELVPHPGNWTYSVWIYNQDVPWMNDFEWLVTVDTLPSVRMERKKWERIFTG